MTIAAAPRAERPLTGLKVAAIFVGGFSIIVGVNVALAVNAVRTFPGTETASAYVASQRFDAERAAQEALGWDVSLAAEDGILRLSVRGPGGAPMRAEVERAIFGRATTVVDDRAPDFAWDGADLIAPIDPGPGNWNLRLEMRAPDGTPFRRRIPLRIAP